MKRNIGHTGGTARGPRAIPASLRLPGKRTLACISKKVPVGRSPGEGLWSGALGPLVGAADGRRAADGRDRAAPQDGPLGQLVSGKLFGDKLTNQDEY